MNSIILHHYDASPFGQIVRLCLAHKGLAWRSVEVPMICPKPDLSALTGGYERVPVLQIGSDIYCDTALIAQVLEAHEPAPSLYPQPLGSAGRIISAWSGNQWFMPAVAVALGTNPDVVDDNFWADRAKRFGMTKDGFLPAVPHLTKQFDAGAALLQDTLSDGRDFVGGSDPGHADFALFVNVRFVEFAGRAPSDLGPAVASWYERISAIGDGSREECTAEEAIRAAAESLPEEVGSPQSDGDFSLGQTVAVTTESPDPAFVSGQLVHIDSERVVVARDDERAGRVHVHLPRLGQVVRPG